MGKNIGLIVFSGYDSRHRCQQCKSMTNMFCIKCKAHLCCHGKRNCFTHFHAEDQYRVINLPSLSHSDSDQDTDVDEVETASDSSDSEKSVQFSDHVQHPLVTSSVLWIAYII